MLNEEDALPFVISVCGKCNDALRLALENHLQQHASRFQDMGSAETHASLREFMQAEIRAGRAKMLWLLKPSQLRELA